jgi:hypothetical protein
MNIQPKAAVTGVQQMSLGNGGDKVRAAIEAFNKGQSSYDAKAQPAQGANELPVSNPSQIAPEEMSAIVPKTQELEPEVGQSDKIEAAETSAEPKTEVDPRMVQLARRERALRAKAQQQEQAFKAREAALAAREAELSSKDQTYKSGYIQKDLLKTSPLQALAEAGLSYDEITQAVLNQQPSDPRVEATISRLEAKIRQLEEASEEGKKTSVNQQEAAYQAAVKQIKADVSKLVSSDPNFETVKATNSINDVVELIEETYKKDGTLLGVEEASQMVEDYLLEETLKLTRIEKIKKRLGQNAQPAQAQKVQQPQTKQPPTMKTLTNAASSTRQLSAKERAILAFRGELK